MGMVTHGAGVPHCRYGGAHLDAPGQWRGQLPSSVWPGHGAVKQAKSGGSVGTTSRGKGRGCGEVRIGQGGRGRAQGGERPMGAAACWGEGFKGRAAVSGDQPIGAGRCRQQHTQMSCQPPLPPSLGASGQQSVATGTGLWCSWAPKAPFGPWGPKALEGQFVDCTPTLTLTPTLTPRALGPPSYDPPAWPSKGPLQSAGNGPHFPEQSHGALQPRAPKSTGASSSSPCNALPYPHARRWWRHRGIGQRAVVWVRGFQRTTIPPSVWWTHM